MTTVYIFSGSIALVTVAWIIRDLAAFRKVDQTRKVMCVLRMCVWGCMLYLASMTAWRVYSHGDTKAAVPFIVWLVLGLWPAILISRFPPGKWRRD